jgi:hypothetical protein
MYNNFNDENHFFTITLNFTARFQVSRFDMLSFERPAGAQIENRDGSRTKFGDDVTLNPH